MAARAQWIELSHEACNDASVRRDQHWEKSEHAVAKADQDAVDFRPLGGEESLWSLQPSQRTCEVVTWWQRFRLEAVLVLCRGHSRPGVGRQAEAVCDTGVRSEAAVAEAGLGRGARHSSEAGLCEESDLLATEKGEFEYLHQHSLAADVQVWVNSKLE